MKKIELPSLPERSGSGSTPAFDEDEAGQNKRFWLILLAFAVVLALIGALLFWAMGKDDPKDSGHKLSKDEKTNISSQAKEFIEKSGTWGLNNSTLSNQNIMDVWYATRLNTPNSGDFFTDRQSKYNSIRDSLIAPNGSIFFDSISTDQWNDTYSRDNMLSFAIQSFQIEKMPDKAAIVEDGSKLSVTVPVTYQNVEKSVMPGATDAAWTGDFNELTKTFTSHATLTLVKGSKVNESWKVSDVQDITNPFALVTWDTPNRDYGASQNGLRKIKSYQGNFSSDYNDGVSNHGKVWVQGE